MFQAPASLPAIPLWLDILKLTIGPVIAAIVFIAGLLWRDRIERRNAAQAWFEQTYITDGIDVVIGHLAAMHSVLLEGERILLAPQVSPLNPHVLRRFEPVHSLREFVTAHGI